MDFHSDLKQERMGIVNKKIGLMLAVLAVGLFPVETGQLVNASLGAIQKAFPYASDIENGLILTLPSLMMIFFSIIGGKLSEKISKKTLLMFGMVVYIFGGAAPAFFPANMTLLLCMRALLGIGAGFILPLSQGLIADYYEGDQRSSLIGKSFAIGSLGSVLLSSLSGYICTYFGWRSVFALYLIFVIVMVLEIIFLPKNTPVAVQRDTASDSAAKPKLTATIFLIAAIAFIVASMMNIMFQKVPILIMSENLGKPDSIGNAFSLLTLASFITGFVFNKLMGVLKQYILSVAVSLFVISYFILSIAPNITTIFIGTFIFGIAMGTSIPYYFSWTAMASEKGAETFGMGVVNAAFYFGCFVSTFFAAFLTRLVPDGSIRVMFHVLDVLLLAFIVIYTIAVSVKKKAVQAQS